MNKGEKDFFVMLTSSIIGRKIVVPVTVTSIRSGRALGENVAGFSI